MQIKNILKPLLLSSLLLVGCGGPAPTQPVVDNALTAQASPPRSSPECNHNRVGHSIDPVGSQLVPQAKQAFAEVLRLVRRQYVDAGLSEDMLWTGAIEGLLARLHQVKGRKINTLITPADLAEMKVALKGTFSGVGVIIKKFDRVLFVKGVLPGSPGDSAGLKPGDRILSINNESTAEMNLPKIVHAIRGRTGSVVNLMVQRDAKEWTVAVTRGSIAVDAASGRDLGEGIYALSIRQFNKQTLGQLDATLERFGARQIKGLVLDVRNCPGGLLGVATEVAGRFLPKGAAIVTLHDREGKIDRRVVQDDGKWRNTPIAVLISPETASGAEVLAAALADNRKVPLIGDQTMGKGTAESVVKLKGGWGLKLSVARFMRPAGGSIQGRGIIPDLAVSGKQVIDGMDPQLRAAKRMLQLQGN